MPFQQLLDILRRNQDYVREYVESPPAACPDDGIALETGPRGELHCPWGHYVLMVNDRWVTRARP